MFRVCFAAMFWVLEFPSNGFLKLNSQLQDYIDNCCLMY
uniref:Uncharacterized protein n=1 Tax=Anguilla anguilla TaxID=7936 RepID=A0A0E9XAX5_ANGAN